MRQLLGHCHDSPVTPQPVLSLSTLRFSHAAVVVDTQSFRHQQNQGKFNSGLGTQHMHGYHSSGAATPEADRAMARQCVVLGTVYALHLELNEEPGTGPAQQRAKLLGSAKFRS